LCDAFTAMWWRTQVPGTFGTVLIQWFGQNQAAIAP
jgi:hypothetical protein